ncbi:hypothetical protein Tco_1249847, partial [Tanacetum coccineum]
HPSDTKVFTVKMEILLEPTSNKLSVGTDDGVAASFQQNLPLRYHVYQGRLLARFQDDAKYEHVGQKIARWLRRSRLKDKDLEISEQKTKSKDND